MMAGSDVAFAAMVGQRRLDLRADLGGVLAPRVEPAPGRRNDRARHVTLQLMTWALIDTSSAETGSSAMISLGCSPSPVFRMITCDGFPWFQAGFSGQG